MRDKRAETEKAALDNMASHIQRLRAVRELGKMNDPRSEEILLKALKDECPVVRHGAISALAGLGSKKSEAALKQLLKSRSIRIRSEAARALLEISGVPESQPENIELLFRLLHSGDARIENAILHMGSPALDFLKEKLDNATPIERQHAAQTMATQIRNMLNQIFPGQEPFSWLQGYNITPRAISDLYRFSVTRKGVVVDEVTNTGFDGISRAICGCKEISFPQRIDELKHNADNKKEVDFCDLLEQYGAGDPARMGRTILAPVRNGFLALKLGFGQGDEEKLSIESQLQSSLLKFSLESILPCPLEGILKIKGMPGHLLNDMEPTEPIAIGYIAGEDYFTYLNQPQLSIQGLQRGLLRCARDLAKLTGCGLIHTSLIPLFHRRRNSPYEDAGYCWQRKVAGRIERWLQSCRYPNLRRSGIADLEHIEILEKISPVKLQYHIGEELLSMSLILASYFRNSSRFDLNAAQSIIRDCFSEYLRTLSKFPPELDEVIDWNVLITRMAEEMGFEERAQVSELDPDGPHLGRLHGPFPVPELIRSIHITSTFAVIQIQTGQMPWCSQSDHHSDRINDTCLSLQSDSIS